jgi:hypothetical protein
MRSFSEFLYDANTTYYEHPFNWRYGQTIMNVLYLYWPEKYMQILKTDDDCFFNDEIVETLLTKLEKEWPDDDGY